jgi:hypothetical protein
LRIEIILCEILSVMSLSTSAWGNGTGLEAVPSDLAINRIVSLFNSERRWRRENDRVEGRNRVGDASRAAESTEKPRASA